MGPVEREPVDFVAVGLAILAIALAVLSATACEPPPDVMPMAGGADGGVVTIQQALGSWVHVVEGREIAWPATYENAAVMRASTSANLPYYFNSAHIGVIWEYSMGGAWTRVAGVPESHAGATTVSWLTIGTGQRGCFLNLGCVALSSPMADRTTYHHDATWARGWTPPGTDPVLPHPPVQLRRSYVVECPATGVYSRPVGYGTVIDLNTVPDQTNVSTIGHQPMAGVFGNIALWEAAAQDCNYATEAWSDLCFGICDCAHVPNLQTWHWPEPGNCDGNAQVVAMCANRCAH